MWLKSTLCSISDLHRLTAGVPDQEIQTFVSTIVDLWPAEQLASVAYKRHDSAELTYCGNYLAIGIVDADRLGDMKVALDAARMAGAVSVLNIFGNLVVDFRIDEIPELGEDFFR